jgi:hypothetical protein
MQIKLPSREELNANLRDLLHKIECGSSPGLSRQVTMVESRSSNGFLKKEMRIEADPSDFRTS